MRVLKVVEMNSHHMPYICIFKSVFINEFKVMNEFEVLFI